MNQAIPLSFPEMRGFDREEYEINGIRTVVYAIGDGEPLVFLHGAGTFPGFEFVRRMLPGRRILIPYHPGFGESQDDSRITSIDDYVLHYADLFDRLGLENIDLAGFSLGGWIAAEFAARLGTRLKRLVLVAPAGLVVREHPVPDLSAVAPPDLPGYLTHDPMVALSYFPKAPDPSFGQSLGREMAAFGRLLSEDPQGNPRLERSLRRITVPTLLMWGGADRLRPTAQADAWMRALPNARLQLFPETGHLLFEERPEAADALLRFLTEDPTENRLLKGKTMVDMPAGVTTSTEAYDGVVWSILGQTYTLKQHSDASMSWHAVLPPGTFVPPHIHPTQDEFVYVFEGQLELLLGDGQAVANAGDVIRLPMGIPHGIFNNSAGTVKCFFWVAPTGKLRGLFERIHNVGDPAEVVRIAAEHEVDFLPPPGA